MAERMRVDGGKVVVEAGAPVTSVDFSGSELVLELGVTLRNCTIDAQTVVSTVAAASTDVTPDVLASSAPPVPPLPTSADVEL